MARRKLIHEGTLVLDSEGLSKLGTPAFGAFPSGSRSVNSLPLPTPSLWTSIVPPWAATSS